MISGILALTVVSIVVWYIISAVCYQQTDYYQVTHKPFWKVYFDKGNYGEYLIYKYLSSYENQGAKFLYNCYLPRDKGETTEIDVLMIHSSGIYVFESKNYSGWIFGNENGKMWTQTLPNGRKSRKEHFLNPIMQNKLHIKWLKKQIGEDLPIHSVIVFSERCTLKRVDVTGEENYVIKRDAVQRTVKKIAGLFPTALSDSQISEVYNKIYPFTQTSEAEKLQHIQNIENNHKNVGNIEIVKSQPEISEEENVTKEPIEFGGPEENRGLICPRCGAELVERIAKKGVNAGKSFYGCSSYPKCRYMQTVE